MTAPLVLSQRHFDAWRRHDAAVVLGSLAAGRTYQDPLPAGPIAGDAHMQPIRELARNSVMEQLGKPAFQAFTSAFAGRRMTTVSAWASHEALLAATQVGGHSRAPQALLRDGAVESSSSAGYSPLHVGPQWRRCGTCCACVATARLEDTRSTCQECGSVVEAIA
jgi:hypothetical protein